ncbi:MAG TPA: TetR/AcrR family transcriptional regulator [Anaerolineales bacterium]|nr:TetR/AcrR family transcriptional regulator [Anaerolineales bacterium]
MTREGILEAAARIFSEKGFHATSMQDIADAVHLQKASLYHHFSSKHEILVDILDQALDLINTRLENVRSLYLTPDEKLRLAMVSYMQTIAENQNLAAVLLLELRALDPELKIRQASRREKFESLWKDLIIEGKQQGIFNDVDPSLTGRAILGVMNWMVTWYRRDGPRSAKEIAEEFADLLLDGLLRN